MIKIVSGYTDKGGSTTAFINLTNFLNENGVDCVFYGPHEWHLNKCKSSLMKDLVYDEDDIIISHFLDLKERPNVKKVILSCHEKWWFPVGKIKQHWDTVVFLHDQHRTFHNDYKGDYTIIPNLKENLKISDKTNVKNIAGIIGTIEDRKQTHVSIQRSLKDKCEKIYLFGHVGDEKYFNDYVKQFILK